MRWCAGTGRTSRRTSVWLYCSAALALRREGPEAAAPFLEELRPGAFATLEAQRILPMAELVVPTLVLEGHDDEARALVHQVIDVLGDRIAAPFTSMGIGRALASIGADDVLRRLSEAQHAGMRGGVGGRVATVVAAIDALVALADGHPDEAIAHVAPYAERERELGWLWDATTLDMILADALAAAGRPDDEATVRARIDAFWRRERLRATGSRRPARAGLRDRGRAGCRAGRRARPRGRTSPLRTRTRRRRQPFERAHEDGELEVGLRHPRGRGVNAGALEDGLPLDQLAGAGPAVPRAALCTVGLELEEVPAERLAPDP